jgi:hypothetical protein
MRTVTRIVRHRNRGLVNIRERKYFKGFHAWASFVEHPEALRGWEVRILEELGIDL